MPQKLSLEEQIIHPYSRQAAELRGETLVRKQVIGTVYREHELDVSNVDAEARRVQVSASSEIEVLRQSFWFGDEWIEVLGHAEGEVRMERFESGGATVHWNHSRMRQDRIGVIEEGWLDGARLHAMVRVSKRDDVADIWNDLVDGLIRNVSIGYKIHEMVLERQVDGEPDRYRVIDWEPVELSFVDIPADPSVGVGRSDENGQPIKYRMVDLETSKHEEPTMDPKDKTEPTADEGKRFTEDDVKKAADTASADAVKRALEADRTRRTEIRQAFEFATDTEEVRKLRDELLDNDDVTVDEARKRLLETIGKNKSPSGSPHTESGADVADKFRDAALSAIRIRAGVKGTEPDPQNELRGYTLVELARRCLEVHGISSRGDRKEVIGRAFMMRATGIGHTSSDFASILANVAEKEMLRGFSEAPETWMPWCRLGNLSDFKTSHRVQMSQFDDLELIGPGGEYKYGTFTDRGETIALATYGKLFAIDRQAIINDDLQAFTTIPMKMGRAAARVPGDLAYAVLTSNPTMSDGTALFDDAGHSNIGTGGVISVTTVSEAKTLMALQSDISGNANGLNIQLEFLIVPKAIEDTALVLKASEFDPGDTGNSRAPNPHRNRFEVVSDPRLDADSSTQWYGAAGAAFDTVEVAFLDGNQEPRLEEKNGWSVDGVEFKVALDVGAAAMEWRTFVRNAGQ